MTFVDFLLVPGMRLSSLNCTTLAFSGTSYGYIHINLQGNKIAPGSIIPKVAGSGKVKTGHNRTKYIIFLLQRKTRKPSASKRFGLLGKFLFKLYLIKSEITIVRYKIIFGCFTS
jgi:hypothetical protein